MGVLLFISLYFFLFEKKIFYIAQFDLKLAMQLILLAFLSQLWIYVMFRIEHRA